MSAGDLDGGLWNTFIGNLESRDTKFEDVAGASESIRAELLKEFGFGVLDQAKLETEWRKQLGTTSSYQLKVMNEQSSTLEFHDVLRQFKRIMQPAEIEHEISIVSVEKVINSTLEAKFMGAQDVLSSDSSMATSVQRWQASLLEDVSDIVSTGFRTTEGSFGPGLYFEPLKATDFAIGTNKYILSDVLTTNPLLLKEGEPHKSLAAATEDGFDSILVGSGTPLEDSVSNRDTLIVPLVQALPRVLVTCVIKTKPKASEKNCTVHPEHPVEFWCNRHACLVCAYCVVVDQHKDHQYACIPLDKAAAAQKPSLPDWTERASRHQQNVVSTLNAIDGAVSSLHTLTEQEIGNVQTKCRLLREMVDDAEMQLVGEINSRRDRQAAALVQTKQQLVKYRSRLEDVKNQAERASTSSAGSDIHILRCRQSIEDVLVQHEPIEFPSYNKPRILARFDGLFTDQFEVTYLPGPVTIPAAMVAGAFISSSNQRQEFTLDPGRCGDYSQMSNNSMTLTSTGPAIALGTVKFTTGRHYWEVSIDKLRNGSESGGHIRIGLATEKANLNTNLGVGDPAHHIGIYDSIVRGRCHPNDKLSRHWEMGRKVGLLLDLEALTLSVYVDKTLDGTFAVPNAEYYPAFNTHCREDQLTIHPTPELPLGVAL